MKLVLSSFLLSALLVPAFGQTVRFETSLGNIDVVLLPDAAPKTVENFLNYVDKGAYNNSFFHRLVQGFVLQGGGFRWANGVQEIPADPAVVNEFRISNTRGTIAMAKLGNDPNSATNQWFFNLANNSGNLDNQNGGFTVFGRVADDASLTVMDRIGGLRDYNLGDPLGEIPLRDFSGSGQVTEANLILVKSVTRLDAAPSPVITGVRSAGDFGSYANATRGSYIEIYGTNLAGTERQWAESDFAGNRAPRSLDNVTVKVGDFQAYISYVSPRQINVQLPQSVAATGSLPVVVTYRAQASEPVSLELRERAGGLLAPPLFKVNDKQYVAALHEDNVTFVSNGQVPGVPAAPARRGERLVFYGVGFGATNPTSIPYAGEIVRSEMPLLNPVHFEIGGMAATVHSQGLVLGLVGLYQFNVEVPANAPGGDQPVRVTQGGEPIGQTLSLPIAEN